MSGFEGLQDECGCLAFPTQEASGLYITEAAGKVALVPACYDEETAEKLMQLYGLWTAPETPVYDTDGLSSLFPPVSDSRALNETYAMLSAPDHQIIPKTCLLGSANSVLGTLLWSLADTDPETLISPCSSAWTDMCSQLEKNIDDRSFRVIFPESINSWTEPYVLIRADDQASSYKLLIESGNETVCEDTNAAPGRNAVPVSAFAKGGDFVLTCRALDSTGAEIGAATQIYTGVMPMQ